MSKDSKARPARGWLSRFNPFAVSSGLQISVNSIHDPDALESGPLPNFAHDSVQHYRAFSAKMKQPQAAELLKTLKRYARPW